MEKQVDLAGRPIPPLDPENFDQNIPLTAESWDDMEEAVAEMAREASKEKKAKATKP